jgi:glycerol-3-phosphate acyltransferase PlsY
MIVPLLLAAVVGYLLGALPFGYLVARAKGVNIFEVGSKNPGATNVRRVLGNGPGNVVLFLDAAKGALAVALFPLIHLVGPQYCPFDADGLLILELVSLVASVLGHSFSCFTGFRGGKGVATGAGGFAVLFPVGALIAFGVFITCLALSRFISLSSILSSITLPIAAYFLDRSPLLVGVSVVIALFVILRHRANIGRLLGGTESKIGQKKPTSPPPAP